MIVKYMRNLLSQQELDVLRSQNVITAQEVAFRNEQGQLVAENVMTRAQRVVSGAGVSESTAPKKILLDQVSRQGRVLN